MSKIGRFLLVLSFLVPLVLVACTGQQAAPVATVTSSPPTKAIPAPTTAKQAWEVAWGKAVAEGKKEGKVVIYSNSGGNVTRVLSGAVKDKFGIDLEWVSGGGPELTPKMFAERRAGLYLADMWLIGGSVPVGDLKPQGVLEPIPPILLLPEVTDPKVWFGGKYPYIDKEGQYVFSPVLFPDPPMLINTEMVKAADIKSYKTLLEPSWKGKIIIGDPTKPGAPGRLLGVLARKIMNPDYLRQLAKQEPIIVGDQRQIVEWVAKRKYPLGMGIKPDPIAEFVKAGAPIERVTPMEGTHMVGGSSLTCIIEKRPHPNATTLFINWFFSKEGQTLYSRTVLAQSAREDVPTDHLMPSTVRQPGMSYFVSETEEFLATEKENFALSKEIFGPLMK